MIAEVAAERRDEVLARERAKQEAADAWQRICEAHDLLSDEKKRAEVDRKASAEAVGSAIGTMGGIAFMGLANAAKFGIDAAAVAMARSEDDDKD